MRLFSFIGVLPSYSFPRGLYLDYISKLSTFIRWIWSAFIDGRVCVPYEIPSESTSSSGVERAGRCLLRRRTGRSQQWTS
ncbi:hypothetical protein Y032_0141g2219 [Ancylostoma ceylanicum]|uniref:Uncharacterized protein n=1 Tax=Ancylostoma ceylanicum TaxID=53326 RepID=A0A016T2W8_9BILA|nr:hypothetical protein Y032_0141g2219 [Ancylostoma ceylanicum]